MLALGVLVASGQEVPDGPAPGGGPVTSTMPAPSADDASIFSRRDARTLQLRIPAPRGPIIDREGRPLAQNRVVYQLAVQYEQFENEEREVVIGWGRDRIATAKGIYDRIQEPDDEELYQHYRHRRWLPLYISSTIPPDQAEELRPELERGLELVPIYERYYPERDLASHVIGYTGQSGKLPTGPINANEPMWQLSEGRAGFEKLYDDDLQGEPAHLRLIFDENGRMLLREQKGQPRAGGALVTTLNLRWQKRAEEVLDEYAPRGAIVVIDAATGEVLVMASNPGFNLNDWIPGIRQKAYDELLEDPAEPLYAKAFQAVYPPASAFKPIVALAALNNGTIRRDTTVHAPAYVQYGNHKLWNWSRSAYGDLSVISAIKWSNNPWFAKVGNRVGSGSFLGLARRLGYGSKTGLPLVGEESGFVPTREWVRENYHRGVTEGDAGQWSIGQGALSATPLQVAQGMAGIANGGALPKLHLVMQIQDAYGRVIETAQPERRQWLGVDAEAVATVREGMGEVVSGGTGRSAGLSWTELGGKTGTGQWGPENMQRRVAWFAGFLPADEPRLAFAFLHEGRPGQQVSGGRNAAPMVPAFFNSFEEEINEMIAPAPKAVAVAAEGEAEEEEEEGVLRAIPVEPMELEGALEDVDETAEPATEEIPEALPVDEAAPSEDPADGGEPAEDEVPRAEPVEEEPRETGRLGRPTGR